MENPHQAGATYVPPIGGRFEAERFATPELLQELDALDARIETHNLKSKNHATICRDVVASIDLSDVTGSTAKLRHTKLEIVQEAVACQTLKIALRQKLFQAYSAHHMKQEAAYVEAEKQARAAAIAALPGDPNVSFRVYEARKLFVEQHTEREVDAMRWIPGVIQDPLDVFHLGRLQQELSKAVLAASGVSA